MGMGSGIRASGGERAVAKVSVIIPAAGLSSRFGGEVRKPFASLDGRPVFMRSIELFINRPDVIQTLLAVSPGDVKNVKEKYGAHLGFSGVKIVEGGDNRFDSVEKALQQVEQDADLVAVHDAVRPCVTPEQIDAVISEAGKTGAAILACPVTGTLKRVSSQKVIDQTVSREGLWEAQTPQVFRRDLLVNAYAAKETVGDAVTDDAQLVEAGGHPVSVVASTALNIKITTQADLRLAGAIMKILPKPKAGGVAHPFAQEKDMW